MNNVVPIILPAVFILSILVLYLFLGKEKYKRYADPVIAPIIALITTYNLGRIVLGEPYFERITLLYVFPLMFSVFAFLIAWYRRERR